MAGGAEARGVVALAADQLETGLWAGAIGLALVVIVATLLLQMELARRAQQDGSGGDDD